MRKVRYKIYHDTRHLLKNGKYPVKLRVYFNGRDKRYPLPVTLTANEFENCYLVPNPKEKYRKQHLKLKGIEGKADKVLENLEHFTFSQFERKMFADPVKKRDVESRYLEIIDQMNKNDRIGTAINFKDSLKSIQNYARENKRIKILTFEMIDQDFLEDYERWMLYRGRKLTTVGIYLRPLRTLFNQVISEGVINRDLYPFGKRKYVIPSSSQTKQALTSDQLMKFYQYESDDYNFNFARDFWFISYLCNGANITDLLNLKNNDIKNSTIEFLRSKTRRTTKGHQKKVVVPLTDSLLRLIKKYSDSAGLDKYVFPILSSEMDAVEKNKKSKNFIRFINQHLQRKVKDIDLPSNISTMWARHTHATQLIRLGGSMELAQESLGHQNITTTKHYFAGFESDVKREFAERLLDFRKYKVFDSDWPDFNTCKANYSDTR